MANKESITVLLNKAAYQAGELVEGVVCLNLLSTFQSRGLFIKAKSYCESMYYTPYQEVELRRNLDGTARMQKVTKYRKHSGRLTLFERHICVAGPGVYKPGQFQVPFVISLPEDLPPTCHFANTGLLAASAERSSADTTYKIKATLFKTGMLKGNVVGYAPLVVAEDFESESRTFRQTTEIVTCGCFGKAPAGATVRLESDVVHPGSSIRLTVDSDNGSSHPFKTVQVRLMRRMAFVDSASAPAYEINFTKEVASKSFPGFTKQEPKGRRTCELVIPADPVISTATPLFECKMWAEVHLKTTLASNLVVRMPLTVKMVPTATLEAEAPPAVIPGWCPMMTHHEPVLLTLDGSPEVPPEVLASDNHFWHSWASAPLVPGCIPPPPEVGYTIEEEGSMEESAPVAKEPKKKTVRAIKVEASTAPAAVPCAA